MNKLIIALLASAFATAAFAQGTMGTTDTAKEKAKAKQAEVDAASKMGTTSTATQAAEKKGVAEAKAAKGTPKDLPTKADKSKAVQGTTAAQSEGVEGGGRAAGAQANKDKMNKAEKKPLTTTKEKQEAVGTETKKSATP